MDGWMVMVSPSLPPLPPRAVRAARAIASLAMAMPSPSPWPSASFPLSLHSMELGNDVRGPINRRPPLTEAK